MRLSADRRKELEKQYGLLIARAWHDDAFKKRLVADPVAVLKEAGVDVPPGQKIEVVENSEAKFHFVLPPRPTEISDEQLEAATGGGQCVVTACCICATE